MSNILTDSELQDIQTRITDINASVYYTREELQETSRFLSTINSLKSDNEILKKNLELAIKAMKLAAAQNEGCGGTISTEQAFKSAQTILRDVCALLLYKG